MKNQDVSKFKMKKFIYTFIVLTLVFTTTACKREDDIEDIFIGKTWYMVGGRLNGVTLNTEVKNFYNYGTDAYLLSFQTGTFSGTLSTGVNFSGSWKAVANSRTLTLTITNSANCNILFDHNVYSVLKNIKYYKGDDQVLTIYADENNFINLSDNRSPEPKN